MTRAVVKNHLRHSGEIFFLFPLSFVAQLAGGGMPLLAVVLMTVLLVSLDQLLPDDLHPPGEASPWWFDALLLLHLPAGLITVALMVWAVTPGDLGGLGQALRASLPFVRPPLAEVGLFEILSAGGLAGYMLSVNAIVAHELMHRHSRLVRKWASRLILAVNADVQFVISHLYGHHTNVATANDPATARRGETLYRFVLRSTIGQYKESIRLEQRRLKHHGRSFWSLSNVVLVGFLMTGGLVLAIALTAGLEAVVAYVVCTIVAKFLLESVNYIQHYGLVREPGAEVESRHSWDALGVSGSSVFYALARHSHHHSQPTLPFWELQAVSPQKGTHLRWGYMGAILIAMVPPLWFRLTTPLLLDWDQRRASPGERPLAENANSSSGLTALVQYRAAPVQTD